MPKIDQYRTFYHDQISSQIIDKSWNSSKLLDSRNDLALILSKLLNENLRSNNKNSFINDPKEWSKIFTHKTADFLRASIESIIPSQIEQWKFWVDEEVEEINEFKKLVDLKGVLQNDSNLTSIKDFILVPDIVIGKMNSLIQCEKSSESKRKSSKFNIHGVISCKWTIRSDRSQNARTEGLNLLRNRKGKIPHICIITAEPYPNRIASVALGTGDIDCVYHIALPELQAAVQNLNNEAVTEMLDILVTGKRLRDIADLPFDLII